MSETEWTVGPYRVTHNGANTYRAEIVAMSRRGTDVVVARIPTPNRSPEQCAGNAALFAAAPDMYAALDALVSGSWIKGESGLVSVARAALARARGETP